MAGAVPIITVALTAYSAVSAVKALSEGNILGAVMGGFGAYMGLSNMGVFDTAVAGDALATSAASDTGGSFLANAQAMEGGATGDLFSGMASSEFTTAALPTATTGVLEGAVPMANTGINNTLGAQMGDIGAPMTQSGGFMESISNGWDRLVETGEAFVDDIGNLVSTKDGSILAKAGEAVGGTGNLMKVGGMAMNYLGKKDAIKAQEDAAEKAYQRSQQEARRARKSVGAAPTYVYDFGGRRESV